jgi:hypothetical protein
MIKTCISCGKVACKQFSVCLQCVCCIPDCESVGLWHSLCFGHWLSAYPNSIPQPPCDWTCWSCSRYSSSVTKRNYEEFMYIYSNVLKPKLNIFLTCQHTEMILKTIDSYLKSDQQIDIRSSSPAFNILKAKKLNFPPIKHYDNAVFGLQISMLVYKLFQIPSLEKIRDQFGLASLQFELNTFLQEKAGKMKHIFPSPIKEFLNNVERLEPGSITSMDDWSFFLQQNQIPNTWKSKLHENDVLGLFNIDHFYTTKSNIRWLSKIIAGFNITGCLTDVVNLLYCLFDDDNKSYFQFNSLYSLINTIQNTKRQLWIPDVFIHDGERDDMLCLILLTWLNPNLQVIVQLPCDAQFDELEHQFDLKKWKILRDPNSRNQKALLSSYFKSTS